MKKQRNKIGEPPVLDFGTLSFEESRYNRGNKYWMSTSLVKACQEQQLVAFEYPLAAYDLSNLNFEIKNADDFIWNMKRCMNADCSYPIILDELGLVADGNHRICKAILDGKRTILAYRLQTMPEPDFIIDDETE